MAGIPQVITEDRASSAQFIDGSVKFDHSKLQHLTRTPGSLGNQKTWTLSFWFKKQNAGDQRVLFNSFTDNSNRVIVRFMSDKLQFALQTGGTFYGLQTNQVFRDNGWYHVVLVLDTTQDIDTNRQKIYVNGNQIADADLANNSISGSNKYPTQNSTFNVNTTVAHYISANNESNTIQNTTFNGQITNVNLVDGLGLGPGYFGFTDPLTNTWRPKKFRAEGTTVNDGTVWSDLISAEGYINSCGPTKAFDGSIDSSDQTDGCKPADDEAATLTLGTTIHGKIRVYFHRSGSGNVDSDISVDGIGVGSNVNSTGWYELPVDSLRTLSWKHRSGVVGYSLQAIEVDGVIMRDSTTTNLEFGTNGFYLPMDGNSPIGEDKSGAPTSNDGTNWSSYFSGNHDSTHGWGTLYQGSNAFDGNLSTMAIGQVDAEGLTWTAPGGGIGANATTIRIYGNDDNCPDDYLKINGINYGGLITQGFSADWTVLKGTGAVGAGITQLESVYLRDNSSGNTHYRWRALEIDGVVLIDDLKGNSWTPENFGGSNTIDKATGAIPILNTDVGGTSAVAGVRTNSKTYTVTASGGNYYLDGALKPTLNAYRGGTYTFDYTGATSHPFYLSSLPDGKHNSKAYSVEFDGSDDILTVPDHSDLEMGSSDFTIECYIRPTAAPGSSGYNCIFAKGESLQCYYMSDGSLTLYVSSDYANNNYDILNGSGPPAGNISLNRWYHLAVCRSGNNWKVFLDGVEKYTGTHSGSIEENAYGFSIGDYAPTAGTYKYQGYISNFRVIKGTAFYTSSFTPPQVTLTDVTNTKLLCCQDSNVTTAAVIPTGSISGSGGVTTTNNHNPFLYQYTGEQGVNTGTSNTTKITIPHWAPDTLYYYCNSHSGMGSSINVTTDIRKADPYAWKCTLALPCIATSDDVSHLINCTTSESAIVDHGDAHADYSKSNFYGGSFEFDGTSDKLTAPYSAADFDFGIGDFTIEAYVYLNQAVAFTAIISSTSSSISNANHWLLGMSNTSHMMSFRINTSGNSSITSNFQQHYGKWTHVAVSRQSGVVRLFFDGVQKASATDTSDLTGDTGNAVKIGQRYTNTDEYGWNGYMQDIRVYNGVAKYTSSFIPASTAPDVLPDTPSGITGKTNLTKITEGAVYFDGTGDYLSTTSSSSDFTFGTGDFTIEMFLYNRETGGSGFIQISDTAGGLKNTNSGVVTIHKEAGQNGVFRAYAKNASTAFSTPVPYKQWCHVALVRESGTIKLFVDGKQDATTISSDTTNYATTYVAIGGYYDTNYLSDCTISNARVIKGTALYTSNFTPPTEPLTAVTNTKLLCCQSTTSATAAAVAPNLDTYTVRDNNGGTYWSGATLSDATLLGNLFDGDNSTSCQQSTNGTAASITNFGPVNVSNTVSFYSPDGDARYTLNGGSEVSVSGTGWHDISFSGTLTSFTFQAPGNARIFIFGMKIDGVELVDIITANGDAAVTNFNPFTDDINTIRGQETGYATWNPLFNGGSGPLSDGNLYVAHSTHGVNLGNIEMTSGKWYFEAYVENGNMFIGVMGSDFTPSGYSYTWDKSYGIYPHAPLYNVAGSMPSSPVPNTGAVVGYGALYGVAVDIDNRKMWIHKDGKWTNNTPYSGTADVTLDANSPGFYAWFHSAAQDGNNCTANFGQKPFKFPPPDGFQPLSLSTVQSEKVIARPDQHVGTTLYTGNNTVGREIDMGRKFDLVWVKKRNANENHILVDTVRGANNFLMSDSTNKANTSGGPITALNDTSIVVDNNGYVNGNNDTYVAWSWRAGGSKGTFNVDDVGYANASDVNMNVGGLNSSVYNQSQVWSNSSSDPNSVKSSGAVTELFNGNLSSGGVVLNKTTTASNNWYEALIGVSIPCNNSVAFYSANGASTATMRINGDDNLKVEAQSTTNGWVTLNFTGTITKIELAYLDGSGSTNTYYGIQVDGKILVDDNITPPNAPSIANIGASVGTRQGFSIIKYAGSGSNGSIAHGLSQAPDFFFGRDLEDTSNSRDWIIYHKSIGATGRVKFTTGAESISSAFFQNIEPTNKLITVGTSNDINSSNDYVLYCWHDVPGLQKFGSYINLSSTEGAFVELGFKPAILIYKCVRNISSSSGAGDWMIKDTTRSPFNRDDDNNNLVANVNNAEDGYYTASQGAVDILSNGFKIRHYNSSPGGDPGRLYIYAAWAEAPSINLYGAQPTAR